MNYYTDSSYAEKVKRAADEMRGKPFSSIFSISVDHDVYWRDVQAEMSARAQISRKKKEREQLRLF